MELKIYSCAYCNGVVKSDSWPNKGSCSSNDGGGHDWYHLGEVGSTNYSCDNCGLIISVDSSPSYGVCKKNNWGRHEWSRI